MGVIFSCYCFVSRSDYAPRSNVTQSCRSMLSLLGCSICCLELREPPMATVLLLYAMLVDLFF